MILPSLSDARRTEIAKTIAEARANDRLMYPYALNERAELVKFDAAAADKRYFCAEPECLRDDGSRESLSYVSASESGSKSAHFKHYNAERSCTESILHREARKILENCTAVSVPPLRYNGGRFWRTQALIRKPCTSLPVSTHDHHLPDAELLIAGDHVMAEVTFQHATKQDKIRSFGRLGFPVLEIDIDRKTGFKHFQAETYERYILERAPRRWLYHPQVDSADEPNEDDPFWMDSFVTHYQNRNLGIYGYTDSETNPILIALEKVIGKDLHDPNVTSGWFTVSPRAWQLHVIRHKLLDTLHALTSDYADIRFDGHESYPFHDRRSDAVARHAKTVEALLDKPLTEPRQDMARACQSLLQRQRIPHESRTQHTFGVSTSGLTRLTLPYRILKAVWSIMEEGSDPLWRPAAADLVRWSEVQHMADLAPHKLPNLFKKVERLADELRRGVWSGEEDLRIPSKYLAKWKAELARRKQDELRRQAENRRREDAERARLAQIEEQQRRIAELASQPSSKTKGELEAPSGLSPSTNDDQNSRAFEQPPPPGFPQYDPSVLQSIRSQGTYQDGTGSYKAALRQFATKSFDEVAYCNTRLKSLGGKSRITHAVDETTLIEAVSTYERHDSGNSGEIDG